MLEEKMGGFEYRGKTVYWDANATEACLVREKVFVTLVLQTMGTHGNVWVIQREPIPKIMREKGFRRASKEQAQNLITAWKKYIIDNPLLVPKFRPLQEIFNAEDK